MMRVHRFYFNFLIILIKFLLFIKINRSNEVFGCGGFIKSHASIDFSKVEIKLFTKQGALKDKTDCSPSNGYYFLPVYEKGEYQLKISPPPGWSFEPEVIEFNFDEKNDICSQGTDINFVFKGFGITGKVGFIGHNSGARGVAIELKSQDGKVIRHTDTDLNGIFAFTPIIPGNYVIKATHPTWHFSNAEYSVKIKSGNTELPINSLLVGGFNVNGEFSNIGQSNDYIKIILYKNGKKLKEASIEKNGKFGFSNVPSGEYKLRPFVTNTNLKLSIVPDVINFKIDRDNIDIMESFEITGFKVSGRVLLSAENKGVYKAAIKLNGKLVTETLEDGTYYLSNVQSGSYKLEVEADKLQFVKQNIQILLLNPQLPDIIASAFEVCGQVVSQKSYVVGITKFVSNFHATTSSKAGSGEWCTYLPSGKYSIEVVTTDVDKSNGIQFFPVKQTIDVISSPISGIIFSQLRATLTGQVICLQDSGANCENIEISLHSLDSFGQSTGHSIKTYLQGGQYSFKNILPGPYELTIPQTNLCFENTKHLININNANEKAKDFIHQGYEISLISSHRTDLVYKLKETEQNKTFLSKSETIKLMSGVNTFCVSKAGEYSLYLDGCHLYSESELPKSFSTADPNPLVFTAISHKIGIRVLSPETNTESIRLLFESGNNYQKKIVTPVFESHKVDGYFSYRHNTYLKPEEKITITPQSNVMLFKPENKELIGGNDCLDVAFNFLAIKGLIIEGKTKPIIKDVKITLVFPNNPDVLIQEVMTNSNGQFKFKPIDQSLSYEIRAEKESYVFSEYDKNQYLFKAHKLSEIVVTVKDDSSRGGNKLSGVLLSLSGAENFRKNLVTADDGTIKFHSLSPSPNYYLRPILKEYKFEPSSKIIEVKDGQTVHVEMIGKRVAYSVFGTISSLNGDSFGGVSVEAIADETCMHHQEESSSENNGHYRIRGLQPGCAYTIRTKDDPLGNPNVERSIPETRYVKIENNDVNNINLIAISPIKFVDVIARVYASSNDFYKTLRIHMYRNGNSDNPIYSQKVESPLLPKLRFNPGIMVFFPRIQLDGKVYVVELKTTLSDKIYKYVLPVKQFLSNTSAIFVELNFDPEIRINESDLNQNSISALILVALVAIAFFKQDLAMDLLSFVWNFIQDKTNSKLATKKKDTRNQQEQAINYKEIEQLADGINSIKRKKPKKL